MNVCKIQGYEELKRSLLNSIQSGENWNSDKQSCLFKYMPESLYISFSVVHGCNNYAKFIGPEQIIYTFIPTFVM